MLYIYVHCSLNIIQHFVVMKNMQYVIFNYFLTLDILYDKIMLNKIIILKQKYSAVEFLICDKRLKKIKQFASIFGKTF